MAPELSRYVYEQRIHEAEVKAETASVTSVTGLSAHSALILCDVGTRASK